MDVVQNEQGDRSVFAPLRRYAPVPVRWTFWDLLVVGLLTLVFGVLSIVLVRVLLGDTAAAQTESPAVNLSAGGLLYGATLLAVWAAIVLRRRGSWREIGFRATSPWWILLVFGILILLYGVLILVSQLVQVLTGG